MEEKGKKISKIHVAIVGLFCLVVILTNVITLTVALSIKKVQIIENYHENNIYIDNGSIENLCQKYMPSVAEVKFSSNVGTGFIARMQSNSSGRTLYIVTNYHVIKGAENSVNGKIELKLFGESYTYGVLEKEVFVVGFEEYHDIAVLRLEDKLPQKNREVISLDNFSTPNVGARVFLMGNSGGRGITVFDGLFSSDNMQIYTPSNASGGGNKMVPVYQTSADINGGSSGSPVMDYFGNFVALATYQESPDNGRDVYSTSYMVPACIVQRVFDNILKQNDSRQLIRLDVVYYSKYTIDFGALNFHAELIDGNLFVKSSTTDLTLGDKIVKIGGREVAFMTNADIFALMLEYVHVDLVDSNSVTSEAMTIEYVSLNTTKIMQFDKIVKRK